MPKWDDYKQEAKGRGALALELFVVTSTPTPRPKRSRQPCPRISPISVTVNLPGNWCWPGRYPMRAAKKCRVWG